MPTNKIKAPSRLAHTHAPLPLQVIAEAHPQEWSANPLYTYTSAADAQHLQPFLRLTTSNLLFDLANSLSSNLFINICATSLDVHDLRVTYRWVVLCACMFGAEKGEEIGEGHCDCVLDACIDVGWRRSMVWHTLTMLTQHPPTLLQAGEGNRARFA